jgi:hypothetical protein
MASDANPVPGPEDEDRFHAISVALADAVEAVLPAWIERLVLSRVRQWQGDVSPEAAAAAADAAAAAAVDVLPVFRALIELDVDQQRANPLSVLRDATRFAHDALADLGVPPIQRDDFAEQSFPDDTYGLVPATWEDVDPSLHDIGITWGAAKAYVHKARRRAEGLG